MNGMMYMMSVDVCMYMYVCERWSAALGGFEPTVLVDSINLIIMNE